MRPISPLIPRQPVPDLSLSLAGGGSWRLSDQKPKHFTMLVVYRGLHCPFCEVYLRDLEAKIFEFKAHGVTAIAASTDTAERATTTEEQWGLRNLCIAYGMTLGQARSWGLYISAGRGKTSVGISEPAYFAEPGLFLIRPDRTLYFASVQSMPFGRPHFADVLRAVEFVVAKDYPARGEVIGT